MKDHDRRTRAELIRLLETLQHKAGVHDVEKVRHARERRQARAALRETGERLRAILETAVEGIITIDDQGLV